MKKSFLKLTATALCIVALTKTQAQITTSFGPEVGFAASGLYSSEEDLQAGINLHVGGTAHIQFGRFFAVRPSVLLKTGSFEDPDYLDYKTSLTRISVPIPLLFSYNFTNDNKIFVGAGPSFMYSLSGKVKDPGGDTDIKFGTGAEDDMKRLDVGLHIKGGFQFGMGLSLGLFFNGGFTNLQPKPDYPKLQSMDALGISVGWMFGGRSDN